jgi:TolB-like protein/DNA-binding winged helix-turn-helix (wHTH) protein/Tfp pilus assembly protein PilF
MPASTKPTWHFGIYEVDTSRVELRRNGTPIKLREQSFRVLVHLLEHAGEVVTREELRQVLWPSDTFVDFDQSLSTAVMRLRDALGDSAETPIYIETIPKHGYCFVAPATLSNNVNSATLLKVETSGGERETGGTAESGLTSKGLAEGPLRRLISKRTLFLAGVATLGLVAIFFIFQFVVLHQRLSSRGGSTQKIQNIAVLPLENLSRDPEQDYFADGMTDALLSDLAKIGALRVISRQSVMRYKGSKESLPQIARELSVDAIVEGTVQRSGDKVRITANLLQAKTDQHLWAKSYERDFRDVLNLQSEVAQDIVREIEVTISAEESRRFSAVRAVNPEAYEDYLKGRFQWYSLTRQGNDEAERYYKLALEKEPDYALAYAGLADVWLTRTDAGQASPYEVMPKALAAADKAAQLDQNLSQPHITLANIDFLYLRDWVSADREFRRAIELNPNSQDAHFMYSDFLVSLKRDQEWQNEVQRALELDPMSAFTRTFYGWHLIYLGRYDEAIQQLEQGLAAQPDFPSAYMGLWGAYYKKQMDAQAMQAAVKFFQVIHDPEAADALSSGFRQAGYREGMKRAANILALRAQKTHVPCIRVARLYAHAGETDKAIQWLAKADEARETPMGHLGVAWDWDSLRPDPRFQEILRRMNFPTS